MKNGSTKQSRFKTVTPVMIYLTVAEAKEFRAFSKRNNLKASLVARQGIQMRMSGTDFNAGFNEGLNEAMKIVHTTEGAKMMFPSGKTFAILVCESIQQHIRSLENK